MSLNERFDKNDKFIPWERENNKYKTTIVFKKYETYERAKKAAEIAGMSLQSLMMNSVLEKIGQIEASEANRKAIELINKAK